MDATGKGNEQQEDDLLDDLMSIVQNEDTSSMPRQSMRTQNLRRGEENSADEDEDEEDDGEEFDEDDEGDEEEMIIDQMLEKPIDILDAKDELNFYTYEKLQIKNLYWRGCQGTILPEGWVQVTHACGMPLYLHRQTRVCTLSRPYFIAQSSARKHEIPMSAIPCLAYKRRKEAIDKQIKEHQQAKIQNKKEASKSSEAKSACPFANQTTEATNTAVANNPETNAVVEAVPGLKSSQKVVVSIQTTEEKAKENMLPPEQLNEYCRRLFEFDVIKVKKFKTWSDRKKFIRKVKQKKFPENSKMLKIQTKSQKGINKELNINMTNKTPLSILYEYSSQVYRTNPRFEIQEKENPKDPFQAICYIDDKICGKGSGNSKKAAKNSAAEAALSVLIPDFKSLFVDTKKNNDEIYSFFDSYNVEHSHVYNLSQKLGAPLPYDVLLTCLKYNFAINMSRNQKQFIEEEIKPIKYRNCLYRMKLAQYDVEVNCAKKKEGRQLAAQKILKTWGSMLRLYGARMEESYLKPDGKNYDSDEKSSSKRDDEKEESAPKVNKANKELLEKLKEEMRKIRKPQVSEPNGSVAQTSDCAEKPSTLLTIPPLLLGDNSDFVLSSCSYLKTGEKDTEKFENDGKIMMSAVEANDDKPIGMRQKRKYSSNRDNSESEEEEGEADSEEESDDSQSD